MRRILFYCLFLLPVLFLIPFLGDFIYTHGSDFTDVAISHYPNALWIQQSVQEWGEIPLWSRTILSGYPFAANPLSGLWYFPAWPGLLFPLPLGLNLMVVAHLALGGFGMYRFLRAEGLDRGPAMLGALAFEGMPKLLAHLGAGHLSLIYAVTWTPWLLLAQRLSNDIPRRFRLLPAVVLGIIALADVRWLPLVGLLWVAYGIKLVLQDRKELKSGELKRKTRIWVVNSLINGSAALGLSAVLLLPMLEYYGLSTRSLMTAQDAMTLSMPPGQLFGLLVPDIGGLAEWVVYPGSLIFFLAILSIGMKATRIRVGFWLGVAGVSFLASLGSNLPGFSYLAQAPGLNLLRVPPRMVFLAGLALSICAAETIQFLMDNPNWGTSLRRVNVTLVLSAITFFLVLLIPAVWVSTQEFPLRFVWGGTGAVISLVVLFLMRGKRIPVSVLPFLSIVFVLIDLSFVNLIGLDFKPASAVLAKGKDVIAAMSPPSSQNPYRVYSPSYSLPQQTAAFYHLELTDGVDPLQMESYSRYMVSATGVPAGGYSVTLPPFVSGEPAVDNVGYSPDPRLLGLLSVRYVVSEYPLEIESARLAGTYGQSRLYELTSPMPRAWVQPVSNPIGVNAAPVQSFHETADQIEIKAAGPGMLVTSELWYPGWQAWVDHIPVSIHPVNGLLRGVDLAEGSHNILMRFQPLSVYTGGAISAVLWATMVWVFLVKKEDPFGLKS